MKALKLFTNLFCGIVFVLQQMFFLICQCKRRNYWRKDFVRAGSCDEAVFGANDYLFVLISTSPASTIRWELLSLLKPCRMEQSFQCHTSNLPPATCNSLIAWALTFNAANLGQFKYWYITWRPPIYTTHEIRALVMSPERITGRGTIRWGSSVSRPQTTIGQPESRLPRPPIRCDHYRRQCVLPNPNYNIGERLEFVSITDACFRGFRDASCWPAPGSILWVLTPDYLITDAILIRWKYRNVVYDGLWYNCDWTRRKMMMSG